MPDTPYIILAVAILLAIAVAAFIWLNRRLQFKAGTTHHTETDLANMMILFQTMRDVLTEQKDLARQFNASLDDKVTMVRKLVDSARDERETIRDAQNGIASIVKQTKEDIATLQQKVASLRVDLENPPAPTPVESDDYPPAETVDQTPEAVVEEKPEEQAAPPQPKAPTAQAGPVIPIVEETDPPPAPETDALSAAWAGADFREDFPEVPPEQTEDVTTPIAAQSATPEISGPAETTPVTEDAPGARPEPTNAEPVAMPMPHAFALPKEEPVSPDESAASRNAFRQLLSLEPAARPVHAGPMDQLTGHPTPGNGGHGNLTPVQRRVYEYSDAGMRVPEIARELGVGKGEVRLILSLRKNKQR